MVIASCNERSPGGRTKRGCMVHVVAESVVGDPLEVGCLDRPSKGAGRPEAHVVCQNQQNIGRTGRSLDAFWEVGGRLFHGTSDFALNRHSPDDSETSVESSDFAASLEARREIWLATSSSRSPNDGRGVDLAIFTGIWTHSSCRLRLNA